MENIIINREGKFRDETVSSIPLGINNINISITKLLLFKTINNNE